MQELVKIMKDNDINLEYLFTFAKLHGKEGLMYFNPINETVDDVEVTNLDPKCFIIDGAKFVYNEELLNDVIINAVDGIITFTRIDGLQFNIDIKQITGIPYKIDQFNSNPIKIQTETTTENV